MKSAKCSHLSSTDGRSVTNSYNLLQKYFNRQVSNMFLLFRWGMFVVKRLQVYFTPYLVIIDFAPKYVDLVFPRHCNNFTLQIIKFNLICLSDFNFIVLVNNSHLRYIPRDFQIPWATIRGVQLYPRTLNQNFVRFNQPSLTQP